MALTFVALLSIVSCALHAIAVSIDCSVAPLSLPWSNITVSPNGLAVTRGIELGIGTPNQIFSLRPSTTLNNTRVPNVLDCGTQSNISCVGGKGGVFNSSKSSTFVVSLKNRWNGSAADTEAATGAYVYFNDVIDFQANGTVLGYPLVLNSDLVSGKHRYLLSLQSFYSKTVPTSTSPMAEEDVRSIAIERNLLFYHA